MGHHIDLCNLQGEMVFLHFVQRQKQVAFEGYKHVRSAPFVYFGCPKQNVALF
jgi:hypothetical protein